MSAKIPDLDQLDQATGRMAGPDLYDLVTLIGDNVRVASPGTVDGHVTWTLTVPDVSALRLPDADEFSPAAVTAAPELFDATVTVRSLVVNQGRPEALQIWGDGE